MITLVQLIIGILLTLNPGLENNYTPVTDNNRYDAYFAYNGSDDSKNNAYQILENKCNVCHSKRNKKRVFTPENMDKWADDVYEQVFIKRRMPRGKKIKLSTEDYQDLLTWISSTKN